MHGNSTRLSQVNISLSLCCNRKTFSVWSWSIFPHHFPFCEFYESPTVTTCAAHRICFRILSMSIRAHPIGRCSSLWKEYKFRICYSTHDMNCSMQCALCVLAECATDIFMRFSANVCDARNEASSYHVIASLQLLLFNRAFCRHVLSNPFPFVDFAPSKARVWVELIEMKSEYELPLRLFRCQHMWHITKKTRYFINKRF